MEGREGGMLVGQNGLVMMGCEGGVEGYREFSLWGVVRWVGGRAGE